jgi:outer membrane murein-binding lipoprotein Lpp
MAKTSLWALSAVIAAALLLSGCVGTSTPPDPDRHPDAAKRKEMRHFYDSKRKRLIRHHS